MHACMYVCIPTGRTSGTVVGEGSGGGELVGEDVGMGEAKGTGME